MRQHVDVLDLCGHAREWWLLLLLLRTADMLIDAESLRSSPTTCTFEGASHGVGCSLFIVEYPPSGGPRLHIHPHDPEVFVIQTGQARFMVGTDEILAREGQIVIAPASLPHRFTNIGVETLRMVNVVPSGRAVVEWL